MSWMDFFKSKPDHKREGVIVGQGVGKKSENRRLMEDIMNPNTNGGAGRGPNNSNTQPKKKKEEE